MVVVFLLYEARSGILYDVFCHLGYGVGHMAGFGLRRKRTLSIEIGMQNAGMGTVLALAHFGERAAVSTAVFVYICIVSASVVAEGWRHRDAR